MSKIRVGAITYTVKLKNIEGNMGLTIWKRSQIEIQKNMEKQITLETLLHEILHTIWMEHGHIDKNDEELVDAVAYGLLGSGLIKKKKLKRLLK
jgi:hypothetical protein